MDATAAIIEAVQTRLAALGYDPGPIDGEMGPRTEAALSAFKAAHGMLARPGPLRLTLPLLFSAEAKPAPVAESVKGTSALLTIVRGLVGLRESPGTANNPRIIELARKGGIDWYTSDATAWCAVFVNGALAEAGFRGTASALARSFMEYGTAVSPSDALPGDIFVMPRGNVEWQGHTGIIDEVHDGGKRFTTIEGNIGDRVVRTTRAASEFLRDGIRRPVKLAA